MVCMCVGEGEREGVEGGGTHVKRSCGGGEQQEDGGVRTKIPVAFTAASAVANHLHLHMRNGNNDAIPRKHIAPPHPGAHSLTRSTDTSSSISSLRFTRPRSLRNWILLMSAPVLFEISRVAHPMVTR